MMVGRDYSTSCIYSADKRSDVDEIRMIRKNAALIDLNADGFFDMRLMMPPSNPKKEVWFQGNWQQLITDDGRGRFQAELLDGDLIVFEIEHGRWIAKDN
jgi:hypothetical protein